MPIYRSTGEPVDLSFLEERTPEAKAFWDKIEAMPTPPDDEDEPHNSGVVVIRNREPVRTPTTQRDQRPPMPRPDIQEVKFQSSEDALPLPVPQP